VTPLLDQIEGRIARMTADAGMTVTALTKRSRRTAMASTK
jgi:hypothetical protein